jgi:outer membrane protein TolC
MTVVDLAQRKSTAVRIAQADVRKAQAALSGSQSVVIPSLQFTSGIPAFPEVGFTGSPPTVWSATIQSLVFSVPQKHYIDSAKDGLQAANFAMKDALEQTALESSAAYIEYDTVAQELQATTQQEGFASQLVNIEQQRAEAGVDPPSELLEARLTAANLKLRRLHLEARAGFLAKQLSVLTGLPLGSITTDHSSIPEIPQVNGDVNPHVLPGIESARSQAHSRLAIAKGDQAINFYPQLSFYLQYNRDTNLLNSVNQYFAKPLPADNLSSGFAIQVPLFDMVHHAKARESAAEALRATVEAEQAERQNELQIAELTGSLKELDAQAEVASLKQQIAGEQLKTVLTELEVGNGAGANPAAPPQLTPKAEQLARIDERQKYEDALDAAFDLAKARLGLLRALGHMEDWLNELHKK